jgi:hypothetical protein
MGRLGRGRKAVTFDLNTTKPGWDVEKAKRKEERKPVFQALESLLFFSQDTLKSTGSQMNRWACFPRDYLEMGRKVRLLVFST